MIEIIFYLNCMISGYIIELFTSLFGFKKWFYFINFVKGLMGGWISSLLLNNFVWFLVKN